MPVTGATSLIGSLSISGIPPLAGFWSKLIIVIAAIEKATKMGSSGGATIYYILAGVAILISIVTLAYYMKFQRWTFFGKLQSAYKEIKEVPGFMCISMIVLAFLSIVMGVLLIPQLRDAILKPAVEVIQNGPPIQ
jgi:multicomponent Na+:H+ antiporter subunit D